MTRLPVILLLLVFCGGPSVAQTIVVRTGDHKGFTRVVMQLPDHTDWEIDRSARGFALKLSMPSARFDYSTVFRRISRDRLASVTQGGPGSDLVFSMGCKCTVASFLERSGHLVIDIKDQENDLAEIKPRMIVSDDPINRRAYRFSAALESALTLTPDPNAMAHKPMQHEPEQMELKHPPKLNLPVVVERPLTAMPSPLAPSNTMAQGAMHKPTRATSAINISEERLLAQINRASDQGLLELRDKPNGPRHKPMHTEMSESHEIMHAEPEMQDAPLPFSLSATTAIDRDLASVAQSMGTPTARSTCLKSNRVALNEWAGERGFDAEIGHWRTRLFSELDRLQPESALGLARAYLHFGFGAEARQAIDLSMASNHEARVLIALSHILETGMAAHDNPFADQQHCDGDVALWSVLARHEVDKDANNNAIKMAFQRLPQHLRSFLGPIISQVFSEAGDASMAKSVLRSMARIDVEPGSGVELAKAAVAEMRGDTETEGLELKKSISTGSTHSPEALVRLMENLYRTRDSVSPSLHELAASYALEYRNTPKGGDLRRTNAVALALAGLFDEAFETLPDIDARDGHEKRQQAAHPLLELLSERGDDITFMRYAMAAIQEGVDGIPTETGDVVGRRLFDLGFPEEAAHWVENGDDTASEARHVLRAEIALARQLPNRAMVELMGIKGPNAMRLRAKALWQQGEFEQAGQMLMAAQDFDDAARGFWMAETWDDVPDQADARYAQIVEGSVELKSVGDDMSQMAPLAEARALMQGSTDARTEIAGLLQNAMVETEQPDQ